MGRLLLMQTYQSSVSFEYIVPERLQKLGKTLSKVYKLRAADAFVRQALKLNERSSSAVHRMRRPGSTILAH